MKLELQVKLKQTIAPQLIQSLRMLQMPLLKLEQTLRQELSINPLLEEVETPLEPEEGENVSSEEERSNDSQLSEINWDDYLGDDIGYKVKAQKETEEERFEATPVFEETLYDHLLEQLNLNKLTKEEYEIGEYIIGNIDENGYLSCPLEEIINTLKCDPQTAQKMLSLIQGFDPPGVGVRDLRESLLMQLSGKNLKDSLAYKIVDEHLSELDKKTISQLAKSLKTDFEEVQEALEIIKGLSPKPAAGRFMTGAVAIIPDLIVEKIGEEYVVFHNDKNVPSLRINPTYKELVKKDSKAPPETKEYVKKKLDQARWLVNALNQRRTTMVKVMEAIVEEQKEFFEEGPSFIKPLIMETIANKVGMHVATVSRVSNDKYVQTPLGIFEIRYFFNSGLLKDNGEELSKRNVKNMIEEFIKKENPSAPLSDQEILKLLKEEGIHIARRTVTKYREELKILPARFRKRVVENEDEVGA
jgi:RNA polymerase sigma-54 factor